MAESELKLDLEEVDRLLSISQQPRVTKCLKTEKASIEKSLQQFNKAEKSSPRNVVPTVTITSYAWDQTEKFVKIYLTKLNGIQNLDADRVTINSDDKPHSVHVKNLNGKNYTFSVPKLAHEVGTPSVKVKSDMLLIMLKKEESKNWEVLTEKEKIAKEEKIKPPPMDKNEDPSASIMNMMKKMYDEGDDEMKRTIAKAWTESRNKQQP